MVPQIIKRKQNHKETESHGFPCDSTINHKETISHGSPCDSTTNHNETISHGAHDINQCTMTKLWNPTTPLTPLNQVTQQVTTTFTIAMKPW